MDTKLIASVDIEKCFIGIQNGSKCGYNIYECVREQLEYGIQQSAFNR